jgi:hypothetical protein
VDRIGLITRFDKDISLNALPLFTDKAHEGRWRKMKALSKKLEEAISENSNVVILINPKYFDELASEADIWKDKLLLHDYLYHTFIGTPILIDYGVDTWEIKGAPTWNGYTA